MRKLTIGSVLEHKAMSEHVKQMESATPRYWTGEPPAKDDFGAVIGIEFIDGRTSSGKWAFMTPQNWRMFGVGKLGTGCGQRYKKQNDNRWLKVEG